MLRLNLAQYRIAFIANAGNRAVAALHETAGIRQVYRRGNLALDNLTLGLILAHDRQRNCRKQCLGVRMQRIFEQQISWCFFYHSSHIHNRNIIREIFYNGQVMGNEDIGQSQILLQLFEQVQNLRLNGNVQRGNRLVADNDFRIHSQSAGNTDTLTRRRPAHADRHWHSALPSQRYALAPECVLQSLPCL